MSIFLDYYNAVCLSREKLVKYIVRHTERERMALLGEEVVEEWLNRRGYFTIRGIKLGVHEIDILAFRPKANGNHESRHIEVQISTNPIAYLRSPRRFKKTAESVPIMPRHVRRN